MREAPALETPRQKQTAGARSGGAEEDVLHPAQRDQVLVECKVGQPQQPSGTACGRGQRKATRALRRPALPGPRSLPPRPSSAGLLTSEQVCHAGPWSASWVSTHYSVLSLEV